MKHTKKAVAGAACAAVVAVLGGGPATAEDDAFHATGRPAVVEGSAHKTQFTDEVTVKLTRKLDGQNRDVMNVGVPSSVWTAQFELEPGAAFPWHTHPGPVLVMVTSGELTLVQAGDCKRRPYAAGSAFVEIGPRVHTAYNDSGETVRLVGTFFDVGPGEALATPAPDQPGYDARCALDTNPAS